MPRPANTGDWLALLALTVMWGTSFALNEIALQSMSPATLVAVRVVIAAFVLYVFMRANGVSLPRTVVGWVPMAIMAVFGNVLPFQLVAWGQQHLDSSVAAVLMAIMPLFVLTLAHFFLTGVKFTLGRTIGFGLGFVGVVFVIGPDALSHAGGDLALYGAIAVLAAALSYAVNSVYARRLGAANPIQLSVGMLIVASFLSMPNAALELPGLSMPSVASGIAVMALGLISTGIATLFYFRLIQGPGPTFLTLVNYSVPAWAVLIGAVFLNEPLTVSVNFGLAMILLGTAISELRPQSIEGIRRLVAGDDSSTRARAATEEV